MKISKLSFSSCASLAGFFSSHHSCMEESRSGEEFCEFLYNLEVEWSRGSFISQAKKDNFVSICWAGEEFSCDKSITVDQFNYLIFEGCFDFLLVQRDHVIDAVIIPALGNIYFGSGFYNPQAALSKLDDFIGKNRKSISDYMIKTKRDFGGVVSDHPSPFHYYAIKLFSLFSLSKDIEFLSFPIFSRSGRDFFDLSDFFNGVLTYNVVGRGDKGVLGKCLKDSVFFVFFGIRGVYRDSVKVREFDQVVMGKFSLPEAGGSEEKVNDVFVSSSHTVLWLGITASKRSWLEEEESLLGLVYFLSSKVSSLAVVVDGVTRPVGKKVLGSSGTKDKEKACRIIDGLPDGVKGTSIVGLTAKEKINIASKVDFFIGNYATGSLWVSRVAGRPGLVHLSNAAMRSARKMHYHPRAKLIPQEYVNDIKSDSDLTDYHVSYSIPKDRFLECAIEEMKKLNFNLG